MKICDCENVKWFSELFPGETFMASGDYYIKTAGAGLNAVRLADGTLSSFERNQSVIRRKLKAVAYVEE